VLALLDAANQLIHQLLSTKMPQHPQPVRLRRHAWRLHMELGRVRPRLSARGSCEVEYASDQQSLCFHESRGSIEQSRKQAKWKPGNSAHS
jgi:hypothetical protein